MKFFLLFSFHLVFLYTYSQTKTAPIVQDPAAEPFLENISEFFDPAKALQIEFKYVVETSEPPSKITDYGSIIIKGEQYKLKTEDGEMYFNGKTLWVYNIAAEEVYKSIPEVGNMNDMMLAPFRLIKEYKKYYKYRLMDDVNLDGIKYAQVELYPQDLNTRKNNSFYSFSMQQKNGVIYTIFALDIIKDLKISGTTFSWDKNLHSDVLEIEM